MKLLYTAQLCVQLSNKLDLVKFAPCTIVNCPVPSVCVRVCICAYVSELRSSLGMRRFH